MSSPPKPAPPSKEAIAQKEKLRTELREKSERVFADVKKRVLALLARRRDENNRDQIDNMITRISVLPIELGLPVEDKGECSGPDAFFSPTRHKVVICPEFAELPEVSIMEILSQEVAHAIDPCSVQGKLVSLAADGGAKSYSTVGALALDGAGKPAGEVMKPGVRLTENPFASVIKCLSSSGSIHARIAGSEDLASLQRQLDKYNKRLRGLGAAASSPEVKSAETATAAIQSQAADLSVCSNFPVALQSQMQESFSDWVGTQVIEEEVRAAPPIRKREIAMEATLSFAGSCLSFEPDLKTLFLEVKGGLPACAKNSVEETINLSRDIIKNPHPEASARVDRLYLVQPNIREALGCATHDSGLEKCE
jgi:hypothetical protein